MRRGRFRCSKLAAQCGENACGAAAFPASCHSITMRFRHMRRKRIACIVTLCVFTTVRHWPECWNPGRYKPLLQVTLPAQHGVLHSLNPVSSFVLNSLLARSVLASGHCLNIITLYKPLLSPQYICMFTLS